MSSLRDQLSQVAQNNATVALDRKRRQKLHAASLVYNSKTAATQDYEYIYDTALESFHTLVSLDSRFKVFANSLFSGTSVSIDRNVQTKEQLKDLDNAVNAYLMLVSSRWHLTPALHATEWLIRRFQIHVHNAEMLLLSTLNQYQTPVFKRILNIVKLPPLFNPLSSFVRNDKNPTDMTLIKLFNDMDFLKLYSTYLTKIIKQKVTYTNQLLFTTCCFINVIAFNANDDDKLNKLVPLILEISAKLLASDSSDCQMAAHTMLAVLATALSLNKNIIIAATETILANLREENAKKSALITISKLFQTLKGQGNVDHLPVKIYKLFDNSFPIEYLLVFSNTESKKSLSDKFFTAYIRSIIRYDHDKLSKIVKILKNIKLEKYEVRLILTDLIHLSEVLEDKSQLIGVFEYFISINEGLVLKCIQALNLTGEAFEIRLTTSLFTAKNNTEKSGEDIIKALDDAKSLSSNGSTVPFKEFMTKNSEFISTKAESMLVVEDERFVKLLSLFVEAVSKGYQPGLFLSSFFTTLESRITFVLRIIVSPGSPIALRLVALTQLSKFINGIDEQTDLFTLVPILITALLDISKSIRSNAKTVLHQIAKRPFTAKYFLSSILYGADSKVPMLSPKDSKAWLTNFLDEYIVESTDISSLVIPSKNELVYMLFWSNQALHMPLAYPKSILLKILTSVPQYTSTYSKVFEPLMATYISERSSWEAKCIKNKTNFKDFETAVCASVAQREKNVFAIDFVIKCLESEFEQLSNIMANRVISLYSTLKFPNQLRILQSIIDSSVDKELSYDGVETLQSLPITADLFVSIFKSNTINNEEQTDLTKRRRRRSSTVNKTALQKEDVSQIAEAHLKKMTIILETLDKLKPKGSENLLNALFNLLSDLETLDHDGGLPVLYAQETLSSCLLNTISSLKDNNSTIKLPSIRADILVASIRASNSPQMQNKLLLVIGALESISPETILHSVMPIFTFMGAHTIRQDDEFSSLVVEKTISTIIPALLNSTEVANKTDEIEFLLMSFSTAFSHVPKHRRVRLYATLVKELGPLEVIAPFMFLIAQQYSNCVKKFKIAESKSYIEFFKAFLSKFDVLEQLHGFNELLTLVELLDQNFSKNKDAPIRTLFSNGIVNMSKLELFELKKNDLDFIDKVIGESKSDYYNTSSNLRLRILSTLLDPAVDNDTKDKVRSEFSVLLSKTLNAVNVADNVSYDNASPNHLTDEDDTTESDAEVDQKELKDLLFSVLAHILDLLPVQDFVRAILPLLKENTDESVRHHLTVVTSNKFNEEPIESFESANEVLSTLIQTLEKTTESTQILQVTLNTIGSIVSRFGDRLDSSLLMNAMQVGCKHLTSKVIELEISSLTILTTLIQTLGVKTLAFYPKTVPVAISIFKTYQDTDNILKEQLQLAVVLLFTSMLKKIPSFLLSNLSDVFVILFHSDKVSDSVRLSVISLIVEHCPIKEVFRTLHKVWTTDVSTSNDSVAVSLFLSMLESAVEAIDKKSATQQSPVFFRLLLNLFEYRSICSFDDNTINRIEASVHQISNLYVLKLNDKVFRPLFALVVNWAFNGEGVTNSKMTEEERLMAFFKFYNKTQENLKSIITFYFTYLLEPTNNLLKKFTTKEIVNVSLRRLVLISLTSSFKYDKDEYWKSTSRFELISDSLINQLGNIEDVIGKYLVKAIGSLAVNNSGVEEHNKIMSDLMISHMKTSCKTREKFWAVRSMKLIYSKVGDGWLALLPRLVPIIAELLEDEDEEVEYEVRSGLVKVVENVLGEPFDRYLS
ncbi:unnamed protein product [Kluyveromyces dobzhanskii CBS 2104]|uniref:U3 small nucleolar RNA-associated protein 10 n=1 Tax=Kluyveromyces dobzhanskii CBS 2104 TaxID=1427455 RepID=A0A0A8LDK2_9SACH|nr:unnamed protein product [Kluyveromyces dobzhanskii CBS 2104]